MSVYKRENESESRDCKRKEATVVVVFEHKVESS